MIINNWIQACAKDTRPKFSTLSTFTKWGITSNGSTKLAACIIDREKKLEINVFDPVIVFKAFI